MSLLRGAGGSSIRRSTSAGSDSGAPPTRDLHCEPEEKGLARLLVGTDAKEYGKSVEASQRAALMRLYLTIIVGHELVEML